MTQAAMKQEPAETIRISARDIRVSYSGNEALHGVSLEVADKGVTSLIGPSGCGKSTFIRCINRMNDTIPCGGPTRQGRHGVSKAEPIPKIDL